MSKYKVIATEITNKKHLLDAIADQKIVCVFTDKRANDLPLYGYQGDERPERVNIAIRQVDVNRFSGGSSNDIGFSWDPETKSYQAVVSDYDQSNTGSAQLLRKIQQRYAYHAVVSKARKKGYNVREAETKDGTIRLQLVRR
jgi:hypothetical protein